MRALEDSLLTKLGGPAAPPDPSCAAPTLSTILNAPAEVSDETAPGGGSMLRVVCAQRDRARREAEAAASEARGLKEELRSAQAASRKLHADNLSLYEKMKFFQTTGTTGSGAGMAGNNSIADEATLGKYRSAYEEKINPFAAFHRRERQQRYAELNPAEKLMLSFSSFFLANRHARLFLFGYLVCLHLLVSGSMYALTHHVHDKDALKCT